MYNRLMDRGRSKQILCPSNINSKTAEHHTNEKLQYLDDLLVVSKIQESEPENVINEGIDGDVLAAMNSLMEEELAEQNQLSRENAEIVKKQCQILKADERGRHAIKAEIAEIKKQQDERSRALQARKRVLEIEKARAKQIASKPPPLPKSIKLLLKEERNKLLDPPKNPASEVTANEPDDEIMNSSDKENVFLTEAEKKAAEKLKEERSIKAQKRFNEALKKDRQKKEQDELLKQIEDAERSQRRETAKNISSENGTKIPCFYPDRLHAVMKNADMENAVEKVCKKSASKEHAIEDIEGYEDIWEKKYEKVNPDLQEKLIDCIPSFVKENYEYLLQEESEYQIGNRFSDEIENELNMGFIQSSPVLSPCDRKEDNMDTVINKLDERRTEFQSMYEKTIKPYLEAEIDASKKDYSDKAVAVDLLKPPVEDKAVEANIASTFQSPPYDDLLNSGVLKFKRRDFGPNFKFFKTEDLGTESTYNLSQSENNRHRYDTWSSSSYCSLPPNHGIPNLDHFCDIHKSCDICVAERNAYLTGTHLQSNSAAIETEEDKFQKTSPSSNQEIDSPRKSSLLSSYVKVLANKYFAEKPVSSTFSQSVLQQNLGQSGSQASCPHPEKNMAQLKDEHSGSSFHAQNFVSYASSNLKLDHQNEDLTSKLKPRAQLDLKPEQVTQSSRTARTDKFALENGFNLQSSAFKQNEVLDPFDQEAEDARLKIIKQLVFKNSPKSNSGCNIQSHVSSVEPEKSDLFVGKSETPHVYHELSTIQEMDSALTSENPYLSYSESLLEQKSMKKGDSKCEDAISKQTLEEECNGTISLLDEPPSHVTELAKNICFVASSSNTRQSPHRIKEPKAPAVFSSLDKNKSETSKIHTSTLDSISGPSLSLSSSCKISFSPKKSVDSSSSSSVSIPRESTPYLHHKKYFQDHFEDISNIQLENSKSNSASIEQNSTTPILGKSSENKATKKESTLFVRTATLYNKDYNNDNQLFSSSNSFNPMSGHSDISSTETVSKALDKYGSSNKNLLGPLSPVLGSIPVAKVSQTSEETENSRIFYPLPSFSKISTPSNVESVSNKKCEGFSDSASIFKALSPVSNISTPISSNSKSQQNFTSPESSNNVNFKPMTMHFNISTPGSERITSDESETLRNIGNSQEQLGLPSLSSVTCNVTVHAKSSRLHSNISENDEILELKTEGNLLTSNLFHRNLSVVPQVALNKNMEGGTLNKKSIYPCKSGFFIPKINIYDPPEASNQSEVGVPVFKTGSLEEIEKEYLMKEKEKILCQSALQKTPTNNKNECETKKLLDTNAISSLISKDVAEKRGCEISSPNKMQYKLHNLKKSHSLQSIASFSSSENLAEVFSGSKITDQSTPIKNFDWAQEKGILEEPNLTLVSTICLEKEQTLLSVLTNKENLDHTLNVKNTPPISADRTAIATCDSPLLTGYADSPSLLSFMQHEISCLAQESAQAEKEIKEKQKNTKREYKKYQARTKRLWNNLEEVQEKYSQENKKQQLAMNRLKAKEFAKKLTPKRKDD